MFYINIYYRNQDPHCKHDVVHHNYNHYESFDKAYKAYIEFYKMAKK